MNACCTPYPGKTRRPLRIWVVARGLRREMSGSALPLFLCRGCRFHFMLRPAFLLPGWTGLLTPRFGTGDLSPLRRPATRRSDAYRDGTCTRRRSAARRILPLRAVGVVTAHHLPSLRPRRPRCVHHRRPGRARRHGPARRSPPRGWGAGRGHGSCIARSSVQSMNSLHVAMGRHLALYQSTVRWLRAQLATPSLSGDATARWASGPSISPVQWM